VRIASDAGMLNVYMLAHAGDDEDDEEEDEGREQGKACSDCKYLDPLISARPVTLIRRVASCTTVFEFRVQVKLQLQRGERNIR
jgi:hypothetical protein